MSAWIIAVVDGFLTGVILYGLVRLRMYLGPVARRKLGIWARRAVWALLITAMVVLADLDLALLRYWLEKIGAPGTRWHYEAVYAFTVLTVGLTLVRWRVLKQQAKRASRRNIQRNRWMESPRQDQ